MKRKWLIIAAVVLALALIGLVVRAKFFSEPGPGGLQIATTPKATVFLNGEQAGVTPFFNDAVAAGDYTVKLVPEATQDDLLEWEGKVVVTSNILTVINREFAADESSSSGEIITLEKSDQKNKASLAVVSVPDQAVVKIDGDPKGFTPKQVDDLAAGHYQVTVFSTGYRERVIPANTIAGYKMTINVKLAQEVAGIEGEESAEEGAVEGEEEEAEEEEETAPTPTPENGSEEPEAVPEKPYVKVKETPTGWLRVRSKPSTGEDSEELARIEPGQMFPYLEEEENGWYKIEYEEGEEGWSSSVYLELFE